jgi:hypothetical protein
MTASPADWFNEARTANHLGPVLVSVKSADSLAFACRRAFSGELWVAILDEISASVRSTAQTPLGICGTESLAVAIGGDAPLEADGLVATLDDGSRVATATARGAWLAILSAEGIDRYLELSVSKGKALVLRKTIVVPAWPLVPTPVN